MTQRQDQTVLTRANVASLIVALLVFGCLLTVVSSCGDDLFIPGDVPATATAGTPWGVSVNATSPRGSAAASLRARSAFRLPRQAVVRASNDGVARVSGIGGGTGYRQIR